MHQRYRVIFYRELFVKKDLRSFVVYVKQILIGINILKKHGCFSPLMRQDSTRQHQHSILEAYIVFAKLVVFRLPDLAID